MYRIVNKFEKEKTNYESYIYVKTYFSYFRRYFISGNDYDWL